MDDGIHPDHSYPEVLEKLLCFALKSISHLWSEIYFNADIDSSSDNFAMAAWINFKFSGIVAEVQRYKDCQNMWEVGYTL